MTHTQLSFGGRIGVARCDITPPIGIYARSWGAGAQDVLEGVHRPLTLTCLTFQASSDAPPLVLFGADLGWWNNAEDEWFVRSSVVEALSLDPARVMFCLSHTHAGPSLYRDDASKPGGEFIRPYLEQLRAAAARIAQQALATAAPATVTWRYGRCDLATNRDLPAPDRDRFLVGFNPAQPADDTLLVGRVTDAQGRVLATVVNYACHPTTLGWDNRLHSPDYIGAMREVIEARTNAPCLFLQGASGELAPAEQYRGDHALADSHGRRLGYAALTVLEGMLPPATRLNFRGPRESGTALAIWEREPSQASRVLAAEQSEVDFVLKPMPTTAQIEEQLRQRDDRVIQECLWRQRGIRRFVGEGATMKTSLWCWRLGDALFFGQPNEAYSIFQIELRRRFPSFAVAVMNIANGCVSYLPPKDLYGHEIYPVTVTPFAAGSLELLMEKALQAGERLSRFSFL